MSYDPTEGCPECGTTSATHEPRCRYPYRPRDGEPTPWTVWGDGSKPVEEDLTEAGARAQLKALHAEGRHDCYAEHEVTGHTIEKAGAPITG